MSTASSSKVKVTFTVEMSMEIDLVDYLKNESDAIPTEVLERVCKNSVVATFGPFIQEWIAVEKEHQIKPWNVEFGKEEQSIIEGSIYSGHGINKYTALNLLKALENYLSKVDSRETKVVYTKETGIYSKEVEGKDSPSAG